MEKIDGYLIISYLILFFLVAYTLINIHSFMPVEKKCESGIAVINKCGCIPDKGFADLFGVKYIETRINLTKDG